jgi:cytochrome c2
MAAKKSVLWYAREEATTLYNQWRGPLDNPAITTETRQTNFQKLAISRLPVGQAWSLAEVDGHILFAARNGKLGYLTGNRVASLGIDAPINISGFDRSELAKYGTVSIVHARVTDMLAIETAPHAYDLYVAHMRYQEECFRLVVSRIQLTTTSAAIEAAPHGWTQIYQTRDCIGLRASTPPFIGDQSGGRLVQLDPTTLALSVGDFEFTRPGSDIALPADPASDLGKIIRISLSSGDASVYASGLRNPQGLLLARNGELWETEHGPQGGDELNLIKRDINYGWPQVTLGASYDQPGQPALAVGAKASNHDDYERPRFSFVPSIGVSNLIEPDVREFPKWDHHLIVASLKGNALHVLRRDGDTIISDEPIAFEGQRIRDLIALKDGRMAFAADDGDIFMIENADLAASRPHDAQIVGVKALGVAAELGYSPVLLGQIRFARMCAECHTLSGDVRGGPPLNGVVGRRVGSYPGFVYSKALSDRNEHWTPQRLRAFLKDVNKQYPGTHMPQQGNPSWIPDIVSYLATSHELPLKASSQIDPQPEPEAPATGRP